ncbi:hypothetical protein [Microcoleus sp.]|uniref:hypothetical protein n=1 Tax=Microcoleus sp. TaxID=44472 RepID=UPI0035269300
MKTQLRIFTMKKSVLTIAIATGVFALAFSGQAIFKGKDLIGAQFNAVNEQGRKLNFQVKEVELPKAPENRPTFVAPLGSGGVWLNGLKWNGWSLNGGHNGLRVNADVLPGTTMQAAKLQGMELQSLKVEGGQLVGVTPVAAQ